MDPRISAGKEIASDHTHIPGIYLYTAGSIFRQLVSGYNVRIAICVEVDTASITAVIGIPAGCVPCYRRVLYSRQKDPVILIRGRDVPGNDAIGYLAAGIRAIQLDPIAPIPAASVPGDGQVGCGRVRCIDKHLDPAVAVAVARVAGDGNIRDLAAQIDPVSPGITYVPGNSDVTAGADYPDALVVATAHIPTNGGSCATGQRDTP